MSEIFEMWTRTVVYTQVKKTDVFMRYFKLHIHMARYIITYRKKHLGVSWCVYVINLCIPLCGLPAWKSPSTHMEDSGQR